MSKGDLRWFAAGLLSATLLAPAFGAAASAAELAGTGEYASQACNDAGVGLTRLADVGPLQPAESAKSRAILGGQPSALEQMRMAQEATASPALASTSESLAQRALSPAAGGFRIDSASCDSPIAAAPATLAAVRPERSSDDFLASKRLTIGHTAFDREWRRVSAERVSAARYRQLIGNVASDQLSAVRAVNGWVNQRIAYTEDRELFAQADFWAGAKRTLKLGRGDCEDIALTKMQLLAAAGVRRDDMILTIARDLVRNADHAVLIVHLDGKYYLLDNATDEVLDASESYDYRPVLSFSEHQTWLHGY